MFRFIFLLEDFLLQQLLLFKPILTLGPTSARN